MAAQHQRSGTDYLTGGVIVALLLLCVAVKRGSELLHFLQ
jgi:hypothetical protein